MFQFLALILTLLAVFFLYLSNKNQQILKKSLPKKFQFLSCLCLTISLFMWSLAMSFTSAFFIWLMTIMLLLIIVPAMTLLKPKVS